MYYLFNNQELEIGYLIKITVQMYKNIKKSTTKIIILQNSNIKKFYI